MTPEFERLEKMVGALLADEMPTPEKIRELIEQVRPACPSVTDDESAQLAKLFEERHGVTMRIGSKLEDVGFEKWLDNEKVNIPFYYWNRYKRLLVGKGFSSQVLATMDRVTDRILGLLGNPKKESSWDRRGMVVGHVQSGKTANYIGLICKAADAGYKVVIVIAGTHNNLRIQTQKRMDEGLMGFDSANLLSTKSDMHSVIGVGRFDASQRPCAFTNSLRDFNRQTATSIGMPLVNLKQPAVFVIKKNTHTLKSLLEWLKEHNASRSTSLISDPMLLIDDEADNASINIKKGQDEVSRINGQIRQILDVFEHSCYVGYTATPFANIFIDPETDSDMFGADLFPKNFIVSLDPPDNYFGASRVFTTDQEEDVRSPVIRHIEDHVEHLPLKHPIDHRIIDLPDSLKTAVRTFIVARAIRLARDQSGKHNSMLVNVSRFVAVQKRIRNEIHTFLEKITNSVSVNASKPQEEALRDPELMEIHQVFADEYEKSCGVLWPAVKDNLWNVVLTTNVIEVHSRSSDSLDYEGSGASGLNVIAVGGFSLSRGLTLEGLIVSYFLRNSMMYDTLMQMGRWFGYRPGYEDLCRVWMLEEAEGWYSHIAESIEELRDEFRRMEKANATPQQFGLRVRSHPDTLIVTARNKMGSGKQVTVAVGLANRFIETAVLRRDTGSLVDNRHAVGSLAGTMRGIGHAPERGDCISGGRLVRNVPANLVLEFLLMFKNHDEAILTETDPIRQYIKDRAETELSNWDVHFAGITERKRSGKSLVNSSLGFELICQRRDKGDRSDSQTLFVTNKQRVCSRGTEKIGLTEQEVESTEEKYRNENVAPGDKSTLNYPDWIYRRIRRKPLLVIHMLAIGNKNDDLSGTEPVVAWSISFPQTKYEEQKVKYVVNPTWFSEHYKDEIDEEEAGGDVD